MEPERKKDVIAPQESEVLRESDWKVAVRAVLEISDPRERFEASREWTSEQRRYARMLYMARMKDDRRFDCP